MYASISGRGEVCRVARRNVLHLQRLLPSGANLPTVSENSSRAAVVGGTHLASLLHFSSEARRRRARADRSHRSVRRRNDDGESGSIRNDAAAL